MPNRILKESIRTSESVDELTAEEEVFFSRLMVTVDDFGRMDARPKVLRAQCFPLRIDRISDDDISRWLSSLESSGIIQCYEVAGAPYLVFRTWAKHQQVRAQRSKYPEPSPDDSKQLLAIESGFPRNPYPNPNPNPNRNPNPNSTEAVAPAGAHEEKPPRSIRSSTRPNADAPYSAEFETFWTHYPRRVSKHAAWGQWCRRLKSGVRSEDLIAAATHLSEQVERGEKEPQFVWHASTFLGPDEHFRDYVSSVPVERAVVALHPPRGSPNGKTSTYDRSRRNATAVFGLEDMQS